MTRGLPYRKMTDFFFFFFFSFFMGVFFFFFFFFFSFYSHYVLRFVKQLLNKHLALFLSFRQFHGLKVLGLLGNGNGPVCYLVA